MSCARADQAGAAAGADVVEGVVHPGLAALFELAGLACELAHPRLHFGAGRGWHRGDGLVGLVVAGARVGGGAGLADGLRVDHRREGLRIRQVVPGRPGAGETRGRRR